MKKSKYIFLLLIGFMLITACSENEGAIYDQGDKQNAVFQVASMNVELLPSETGGLSSFSVKLHRGNTKNVADIALTLKAPEETENINFQLASPTLHFDAGQNVAEAIITYNYSEVGASDSYSMLLSIASEEDKPIFSKNSSINISARKTLTYSLIEEEGIFVSSAFGGAFPVVIYRAQEDPNIYKLSEFFINDIIFVINPANGTATISPQSLGEDIFGTGTVSWITGLDGTYANGSCIFGGGTWDNAYYTNSSLASGLPMADERIILPTGSY
jgi:hypothetical protein